MNCCYLVSNVTFAKLANKVSFATTLANIMCINSRCLKKINIYGAVLVSFS